MMRIDASLNAPRSSRSRGAAEGNVSNTRLARLAIAVAAACAGVAWAEQGGEVNKEAPPAATMQSTQPQEAQSAAAMEATAQQGSAAATQGAAQPQQPVAQAPARRKPVTTAEIEEMNRRYPGG